MVENIGNVHEFSVSELAGAIRKVVEDGFGHVRVRGELGRVTRAASGHVYVDLKDEKSVLSTVIWKGAAERLRFQPEQGMEVVATGRLTTFPGQSRYQLVVDSLEPAGAGALMALLEERKKKLAAEGLFAAERKRPLPFLPGVVGVITSPSGAVIRDILHRLRERFPRHVLVWPTLVQGKGAELKIAAAIDGFNALSPNGAVPRPDVLIVARGGGSLEDLWCFNEEVVVRAAAASRIPLISAVGHETDTTLIDFAADRRAPTPSAAAEMAVPVRSDLLSELRNKERRLLACVARGMKTRRDALIAQARALGRPEDLIGPFAQRFDRAGDLLTRCARARLHDAYARHGRAVARLGRPALDAGLRERALKLSGAEARLRAAARRTLDVLGRRLSALRISRTALDRLCTEKEAALARAAGRARPAMTRGFALRAQALRASSMLLQSLSHESVLQRGFALVRTRQGAIVARAAATRPGEEVALLFADGERGAVIAGGPPPAASRSGAKEPPPRPGPKQKSLFE